MNRRFALSLPFIVAVTLGACSSEKNKDELTAATTLKYATGFSITKEGKATRVTITTPYPDAREGIHYYLLPEGEVLPMIEPGTQIIRTPITRIVCTSTTHIPLLDYLNESKALIGFPTTDYISSPKMRARIEQNKVVDLGVDKGMNLELLFSIHPQLVMGYTMSSDLGQLKKIKELEIPVVINAEYLEKHPLGRAEWIKFMALFFHKEREADSIFNVIEKEYLSTVEKTQGVEKPTVLSGIVYGDTWFMPGGKNYAAKLFQDAGTHYLWSDTDTNGFLELSFESVFDKAKDAYLWIGVGSFETLDEIKESDKLYTLFKPFQSGQVYTFNARKGAKGGSEFLELGYLRPDLILKDLVKIAHPELLPEHEFYFHKKLN